MTIEATNRAAAPLVSAPGLRPSPDISVAGGGRLTPAMSNLPDSVGSSGIRSLVRDMASAPPVNGSKVAGLKSAIAAGTYKVQPQKLADAMIRLSLPDRY